MLARKLPAGDSSTLQALHHPPRWSTLPVLARPSLGRPSLVVRTSEVRDGRARRPNEASGRSTLRPEQFSRCSSGCAENSRSGFSVFRHEAEVVQFQVSLVHVLITKASR